MSCKILSQFLIKLLNIDTIVPVMIKSMVQIFLLLWLQKAT